MGKAEGETRPETRKSRPAGTGRPSNNHWQGQIGTDGSFAVFDTPENGDCAHGKLLTTYQRLHGINTVRGAISLRAAV